MRREADSSLSPANLSHLLARAKRRRVVPYNLAYWNETKIRAPSVFLKTAGTLPRVLNYGPCEGLAETRKAWASYFHKNGIRVYEDDVVITNGASEALLFSFALACKPGEELLVFEPLYSHYKTLASFLGITLVPITTFIEKGFRLPTRKEIEKRITQKTKGILVCNPNNPSGAVYTRKKLKTLCEIARKRKLTVISDEIYREYVYGTAKHHSLATFPSISGQLVLVESLSKKYAVCGMRSGCLASKNKEMIKTAREFAFMRLSCPVFEQLAAARVLQKPVTHVKEYAGRLELLCHEIKRRIPRAVCRMPQGGLQLIVKLPFLNDSDAFAYWLANTFSCERKTVLAGSATRFYVTKGLGKDEIYFYPVLPREKLAEAVKILQKALERYELMQPHLSRR